MKNKRLGLYLHIPFCIRKCNYCDFLSFPAGEEVIERYVNKLILEMQVRSADWKDSTVDTVFLGGGTPSVLSGTQIERIMQGIFKYFSVAEEAEITMEINPKTAEEKKFKYCRENGINRLSFGVQSFDEKYLKMLGRIHSTKDFYENYEAARKIGFTNINIDLMSALPTQTVSDVQADLKKAVKLSPEHISCYGLIIEEGTPFFEKYEEQERRREEGEERAEDELPEEKTEREMYRCISNTLQENGYLHYEISNYAKAGYECNHNLKYWERKECLGIGLGAASLLENVRYANVREIKTYLEADFHKDKAVMIAEKEVIDTKAAMEEFMFLGLRKMQGISRRDFENYFQKSYEEIYGEIHKKLRREGLISEAGEHVRLSEAGIDVSNYVMAEYLL